MKKYIAFAALAASSFPFAACTKDAPEAEHAHSIHADASGTHAHQDGDSDHTHPVFFHARVIEICELPEPSFAFDSKKVTDAAEPHLDGLATCLTTGPLAGERVRLVGHADKRGPSDYNMDLGQSRATSVKQYLVKRGVEDEHMETDSMGEIEADGNDGWANDRRVEVQLLD